MNRNTRTKTSVVALAIVVTMVAVAVPIAYADPGLTGFGSVEAPSNGEPVNRVGVDHQSVPIIAATGASAGSQAVDGDRQVGPPTEITREGCFKIDGIPEETSYHFSTEAGTWNITVTDLITESDNGGTEVVGFNFTSNRTIVEVRVKGGDGDGGTENYTVTDPELTVYANGTTVGTNLLTPLNDNTPREGDHFEISHVVFCPGEPTNGENGNGQPETAYYQVDFVVGEPLEQVGPEDGEFYHDQDRMIRFLHGHTAVPVTRTGSGAWVLPDETRECIDSEPIQVHGNGTASVRFTVASGCELTLTLASHEKPGLGFDRSMTQPLFDAETETFGPGTYTLRVDLPP